MIELTLIFSLAATARGNLQGILSPLRLPVSPRPHEARFFHILRRK
jgi:hypothetical protein